MSEFQDSFGRKFRYVRISVTERCNFRCVYCLPNGYQASSGLVEPELSLEEIRRLCAGFDRLDFSKVRITGGEPTVRKDLVEIVSAISSFAGFRKIALTTNGHNLERLAAPLRRAGLTGLNVSLDSLDSAQFAAITGSDRFQAVARGIEAALACDFDSVKVNAVLLKGSTEAEFPRFLEWIKERPVSVRFIELMRTGWNAGLFRERHLGAGDFQLFLLRNGWKAAAKAEDAGPALEYTHPEFRGKIGLIAPYARDFCANCNRLRVSSRGSLKLCLFGEEDFSLRPYLAGDDYAERVAQKVNECIYRKPESHYLKEGKYGNTWSLASIGG